jgi:hypothetical protein
MVQTLFSLPADTTEALKIAACLGSSVDMVVLEYILQGFDFRSEFSYVERGVAGRCIGTFDCYRLGGELGQICT